MDIDRLDSKNLVQVNECQACGSRKLVPYLNLGNQPLANNYHKGDVEQPEYPLAVQVCSRCFHSQLMYFVDPKLMFDNYFYVSGTSKTLTEYFEKLADDIVAKWEGGSPPKVLEIASNDGTLLGLFKDRGCEVMGIDPAKNLVEMCSKRNLRSLCAYWDDETAKNLGEDFDVVIAVNVLPHVPAPVSFLRNCRRVLRKNGKLYIQTSQFDMFRNTEFDAIYHEHHSYFTAGSMTTALYRAGFVVTEATKVPIHSMSILVEAIHNDDRGHRESLNMLLQDEARLGWDRVDSYHNFSTRVGEIKDEFLGIVGELRRAGKKLIGYGASAKSSTVLNYFGIDLDYFVDDNEMKHNYQTPGRNIPILPVSRLKEEVGDIVIVLTAWNFKEEITSKILDALSGSNVNSCSVISYIPEVRVEMLYERKEEGSQTENGVSGS